MAYTQQHQQQQVSRRSVRSVAAHAARRRTLRVGRQLANRNEIRVSGSDSYALLFLSLNVCAF